MARDNAKAIAAAALSRLKNWDISADQLARLQRSGVATRTLTLSAPIGGIVMEKTALQGLHFGAGDMLYRIVDLSTVWLLADVFEQDLAQIRPGQSATITVQAYPGRVFEGRVAFVYPTVNAQTRTAKVRIEVPNPDLLLKTDMYATVEIAAPIESATVLAVPDSAVLDTGSETNRACRPRRRALRAARGQARGARRRLRRRARGAPRRREGRHRRQLPHRCREQSARGPAGLHGAGGQVAMIGSIITWSARNTFLVLLATAFIIFAGVYAVRHTALDAIPDLSDTQVIVYTEYPGQAPQVIEDQVTYPLTTALLAVPRSKVVRGFSFFGVSFVYVVFEDGTDLYWARSRVLEYLNFAAKRLPEGITPSLGPDATGVGWVYQYVVLGAERTLAELRTIQDWYLRYQLTKAEGVAEVASVGGFVQQYQVVVDPQKLQAYGLTLAQVTSAIRASNRDVGGRVPSRCPRPSMSCAAAAICAIPRTSKRSRSRCRAARRCCCATWRD